MKIIAESYINQTEQQSLFKQNLIGLLPVYKYLLNPHKNKFKVYLLSWFYMLFSVKPTAYTQHLFNLLLKELKVYNLSPNHMLLLLQSHLLNKKTLREFSWKQSLHNKNKSNTVLDLLPIYWHSLNLQTSQLKVFKPFLVYMIGIAQITNNWCIYTSWVQLKTTIAYKA